MLQQMPARSADRNDFRMSSGIESRRDGVYACRDHLAIFYDYGSERATPGVADVLDSKRNRLPHPFVTEIRHERAGVRRRLFRRL
jgi:hypothetical protein